MSTITMPNVSKLEREEIDAEFDACDYVADNWYKASPMVLLDQPRKLADDDAIAAKALSESQGDDIPYDQFRKELGM